MGIAHTCLFFALFGLWHSTPSPQTPFSQMLSRSGRCSEFAQRMVIFWNRFVFLPSFSPFSVREGNCGPLLTLSRNRGRAHDDKWLSRPHESKPPQTPRTRLCTCRMIVPPDRFTCVRSDAGIITTWWQEEFVLISTYNSFLLISRLQEKIVVIDIWTAQNKILEYIELRIESKNSLASLLTRFLSIKGGH